MSKRFAVANTIEPVTVPLQLQVEERQIMLTVDRAATPPTVNANAPFVRVSTGAMALLTWTIDPTDQADIVFDTPGISFFGESPNMVRLDGDATSRTALWCNDRPGQSYSYRIHLLHVTGTPSAPIYTPITNDPIIRNDPPTIE